MQGGRTIRLATMLATVVLFAGSNNAWSQEVQPEYPASDASYSSTAYSTDLAPPVSSVSYDADASLADEVADLKAWKEGVLKKEAAAKKKAAGKPSVAVGGRIFADWYGYTQDAASMAQITDQENGFRFDTVRIFVKGSAFHVVDYKVQFDFAGTQSTAAGDTLQAATFKDVFIAVKELPVLGHVKTGHYKEPFSLDQLTSSRFITFMERSLADVFVPARNVGVMAYDHSADQSLTWGIGAFISEIGDEPPRFMNDNGGTAVTMRGTWLPWYDEATNGRGLMHLGVCYSYRDIADGTVRFRRRPEADLGDYLLDTGTIAFVSDMQLLGVEAAFVYGPFRIQSEYITSFVRRTALRDVDFSGAYVQVSYFLTGEQRKYKRSAGTFSDRVVPFENFFRVRDQDGRVQTGIGAWEVAYRASYLDLNDVDIAGGNATNHTIGLNWYLNPYTRLMFNYINSDARRGGLTGNMNILATRFQIDY